MSQTIHQRQNLALIKAAKCRRRANRDRDAIATARHDHRSKVGEWQQDAAESRVAAMDIGAPGEDGSRPLVSSVAENIILGAMVVATACIVVASYIGVL
jgi:hypothetical protein